MTTSRRDFLGLAAVAAVLHGLSGVRDAAAATESRPFRVRTITAGVTVGNAADLAGIETALAVLDRAKQRFVSEGYEVQTVRVATTPFVAYLAPRDRARTLQSLRDLDAMVAARGAIVSIGPVMTSDADDAALPDWIAALLSSTRKLSTSIAVASRERGVHSRSANVAARAIAAVAQSSPDGLNNFHFAATACVPAGTPFFPAAWHDGPPSLAVGLETAGVVEQAIANASDARTATERLKSSLTSLLTPIERTAQRFAEEEQLVYLGIDPSPAPSLDRSIGAAIESYTHAPFGAASTLEACAAVTEALRSIEVRTCGYAGLMLPVLEDPRIAQRATEGRFGWRDLLLYSSVCGTGLDVVPIPGSTSVESIARVVRDMAALSARWQKPLSARLLQIPGAKAGDMTRLSDPLLTNCAVLSLD